MDEYSALARGAIAQDEDWERALQKVLEQVYDIPADAPEFLRRNVPSWLP